MTFNTFKLGMVGLVSVIIFALIGGGFWFYEHEKRMISSERYNDLKAIAGLKVDQITAWREERIRDVRLNASAQFLRSAIDEWIDSHDDAALRRGAVEHLTLVQKYYGYDNVILVGPEGRVLLSLDPQLTDLEADARDLVTQVFSSCEAVLGDFFRCQVCRQVHLDVAAPILDETEHAVAVLILRSDPDDFLYPLIQSWPTPNRTSETLLIRRDGDSVLFLNKLRHKPGPALTLRIPLWQADLPAARAARGEVGEFEGQDYRGAKVLSTIQAVPGTSWFMVAKMDRAEILAEVKHRGHTILLLAALSAIAMGAMIAVIFRTRQKILYHSLYQAEREQREIQEEIRTTLYSLGEGVITTDVGGVVTRLNPAAERLTGWTETEAQDRPLTEVFRIINEETRAKVEDPVERVMREGGIVVGFANHTILITKNGTERPIAESGASIRNEQGEIAGIVVVFQDQTAERAANRALQISEARYRRLFESAQDGILILDADTKKIIDANPFMQDLLGYSCEEFVGKELWSIGAFKDVAASRDAFDALLSKGHIRYENLPLETGNGQHINVEFVSNVYMVDSTRVIQCNIRDITERKHAEDALRDSEDKFKFVFDYSAVGKSITLPGGEINVNKAFCETLGYSPEELQGKRWQDISHPDEIELAQKEINALLSGEKEAARFIKRYFHKNGSIVWVAVATSLRRDKDGSPLYLMTTVMDITERRQMEERLRESEEFVNRIIDSSNDCVKVLDLDGHLLSMSKGGQELLEIDDMAPYLNKLWTDFWKDKDRESALEAISKAKKGDAGIFRGYCETAKGQPKWWEIIVTPIKDAHGNIYRLLAVSRDITERKRAEVRMAEQIEELRRWQSATLGRETRILDLKREVNELLAQTGQPPRYTSPEIDNDKDVTKTE